MALEAQRAEAMSKRRIGLATGLGDAHHAAPPYDTEAARDGRNSEFMRRIHGLDRAREERGAFPMFNKDLYLSGGNFASRLPEGIKQSIRKHGIRNSHLLSIAPTGTISLAFADNASNGIEPPFSWTYTRKKRMADGTHKEFRVEDHAWRPRHMFGAHAKLPEYFVTALEISADAHQAMVAVAPFIDTSISKTVNVAEDYPRDFESPVRVEVGPKGSPPIDRTPSGRRAHARHAREGGARGGDSRRWRQPPTAIVAAATGAHQPAGPAARRWKATSRGRT
jgi:ribonucleoside-diphosphate reductase alpha chain